MRFYHGTLKPLMTERVAWLKLDELEKDLKPEPTTAERLDKIEELLEKLLKAQGGAYTDDLRSA